MLIWGRTWSGWAGPPPATATARARATATATAGIHDLQPPQEHASSPHRGQAIARPILPFRKVTSGRVPFWLACLCSRPASQPGRRPSAAAAQALDWPDVGNERISTTCRRTSRPQWDALEVNKARNTRLDLIQKVCHRLSTGQPRFGASHSSRTHDDNVDPRSAEGSCLHIGRLADWLTTLVHRHLPAGLPYPSSITIPPQLPDRKLQGSLWGATPRSPLTSVI